MVKNIAEMLNELLAANAAVRSSKSIDAVRTYFSQGRKFSELKTGFELSEQSVFKNVIRSVYNLQKDLAEEISCNPFQVKASFFDVDLLTDSGTSTLRTEQKEFKQWYAENVKSIECFSYARLTPREHLNSAIDYIFGENFDFYPTLQGRASEKLLLEALMGAKILKENDVIVSNRPFDTTKGHIGNQNVAVKALTKMADPDSFLSAESPFMGNIDELILGEYSAEKYAAALVTMTDNGGGGQPVSMKNYKFITEKVHNEGKFLWLDACRIFENALFIKAFEKGYEQKGLKEIVYEIADVADVITISFKKIYSHSGGGILINKNSSILTAKDRMSMDGIIKRSTTVNYGNGFNSYSGLTGEGMVEIMSGLMMGLNEKVVADRIAQVGFIGAYLREKFNLPVVSGGHALYVAADKVLPNVPLENCPAEYLNAMLMAGLKTRGCGLGLILYGGREENEGEVKFTTPLSMDSLRLAIPRDVYSNNEILSVLNVLGEAFKIGKFKSIKGGLKPRNYVGDGFYHFGGEYDVVDKNEFNAINNELINLRT
ncbi:MAG: beta-eliminating lyase-related protein [Candidatus Woesearchaeota archaeon]|jgi:tryptophanase